MFFDSIKALEYGKRFLIASINVEEIINMHTEIDAYSQGKFPSKKFHLSARNTGKNDLWIAAKFPFQL